MLNKLILQYIDIYIYHYVVNLKYVIYASIKLMGVEIWFPMEKKNVSMKEKNDLLVSLCGHTEMII